MAKDFNKSKSPEDIAQEIASKRSSRPTFEIRGKQFYIKKWPHLELWERVPMVANLFLVPLTTGYGVNEYGETLIDEATTMNTLFTRLQDQDMTALLQDLSSCVYCKDTNEVIDLEEDLEEAEDICIVIREVFKNSFLFLFNGGFTEILSLGSAVGQVHQNLSRDQ